MSYYKEIYRYTFKYKTLAWLTILYNFLFVVFNLLSLVLFVPVLQLIFKSGADNPLLTEPKWNGGLVGLVNFVKDTYNYQMQLLVKTDPKGALLFVCVSVFLAFLLKNVFRYGAVWTQSRLRMSVVRDVRGALFEKALRLFKKKVDDSGLLKEVRDREAYVKPTIKRKLAKNAARRRWQKYIESQTLPTKNY